MGQGRNRLRSVGWNRVFYLLGGIYVVLAVGRALYVVSGSKALSTGLIDFLLVGAPGLVLLYGGYRLPEMEIDPETYTRIAGWCLGGFAVTLGLVELLRFEPGVVIRYPRWSLTLTTSIGTASGFLVGAYDARGRTQSRQLRRQRRQLRRQQEELREQSEELQRQNSLLDNFASLLAHELRNPLSVARIYLGSAVEGDRDAAEELETALTRIEEMVEIILVITRGEDADIDREAVALAKVAEAAWVDLDVSNAELAAETDLTLLADPIHLRHLLENLFTNAVEHADGSVTIRVGDLDGGFYVEDDGPGIPEAERERIFDAGYTTGGTGFGLMFVAELAETYGWDYSITDGESGGARFEFTDVDRLCKTETSTH